MGAEDTERKKRDKQDERDDVNSNSCVANKIVNGTENVLDDLKVGGWVEKLVSPTRRIELDDSLNMGLTGRAITASLPEQSKPS